MRTKKCLWLLCLAFGLAPLAWGRGSSSDFGLDIEPLIGYERVRKLVPSVHTRDRLVYGGRLTLGVPLFSIETEYTRAQDSESFTSPTLSITDTTDKLKLGVRSSIQLDRYLFSFVLRAGVQAKRNVHEQGSGGAMVRTEEPLEYDLYAGTGLKVKLGQRAKVSLFADFVVVFNELNDFSQNEYLISSGLSLRV
ncbi:MAG: hypothetical protein KDD51_04400 [Bdellovibrionales bacterium]|nr:hypothetical protein [Bdellovibrionales bacterium]